ncbi:MAG: GMP synthase subunit A [Candidatus Thermoplasmatota archaeon]
MTKIYVIDNGGQWTHREWRSLKYLGVKTRIVPNSISYDILKKKEVDGIVLSGGSPRIGIENKLGNCPEILENADFPILGICAGLQFMARFYGGEAKPSQKPEFGKVEITIIKEDKDLLKNIPNKTIVWESHNDEVTKLPEDFLNLAESENCKIQAIAHKDKPLFGLQFHPEVEHTEYGEKIFKNFVEICKKN